MRSATSYFNGTLYRKTMARFWPLWAGYGVIWLFSIPLNMLNTYFNHDRYFTTGQSARIQIEAANLPEYVTFGLFLAAFFAIFCAMAVFGYLYNSRSACWFHALPTRREALFTTQYLAGLSFLLLPQLAVAVLTAIVEVSLLPMDQWGMALSALLMWLLAQSGAVLFFFSFAAFCAMFTGHILALPAFYCILNVLAAVIWYLLDALMSEFYYGYAGTPGAYQIVEYLTPAYALKDAVVLFGSGEEGKYFRSPATVAVYAGIGVLLALASLYVYRRRHAETAGDVVAVPLVRPLFKYGVSFCAGLCFGMFTAAFFGWGSLNALIPCVLAWTLIGYFAAEMLLKKSFRVLKAWKGGAVMAAVVLVLCLVCLSDVLGVVSRVPNPEKVQSVYVQIGMGYPYDSGNQLRREITDPAQIEKIVALHQAIVDNRDSEEYAGHRSENDYTSVCLSYTLTGGGSLDRNYHSVPIAGDDLDAQGTVAYAMRQILEDRALVAMAYGFDGFLEDARLTSAYLELVSLDGEPYNENLFLDDCRQELWDAVQKDFFEGNIGVRYLFDSEERYANTYMTDLTFEVSMNYSEVTGPAVADNGGIYYEFETRPSNRYLTVTLAPQARHTLAVLEETGIFEEGYALVPWDDREDNSLPYTASAAPGGAG